METTVTDNTGKVWEFGLTLPKIRALKAIDFDLQNLADSIPQLMADPFRACDILIVAVSDQFTDEQSQDDFEKLLDGDFVTLCKAALVEAVIRFHPIHQRKAKRDMIEKFELIQVASQEKWIEGVANIDVEAIAKKAIDDSLANLGKN